MGQSIATLLILAVLFTGVLVGTSATLFGDDAIESAIKEATYLEGERARTATSIVSTKASNVFRCDTKVQMAIDNIGDVSITDFDQMDVLTWYTPESGDQVTRRFSYTIGNMGKEQWAIVDIAPDTINPGMWDPDEAATIAWRFGEPPQQGTSGYLIVGTPNGISDSDYVSFSDVGSAECYFLHNNPTPPNGGTPAQATLPIDTGLPSAAALYNYDNDRDANPGLKLLRSQNGLNEVLPNKFQAWRTGALTSPLTITGDVLVDLWGVLEPATTGDIGVIITYLRDYDGASYTEIGEGAVFARDWQSGSPGFVERMALVQGVNYTVAAGNEFEIRMVLDDASNQDMQIAYDTRVFPSLVNLSFSAPPPSVSYYLHNNPTPPTGDTSAQAVLSIDTTAPTATTLYRYSLPNNNTGLELKGSLDGLNETDSAKYQVWRTGALASPLAITGDIFVDLWAAIRNFQLSQSGAVTMYLRDYDGSAYVEIGSGSAFAFDWQDGANTFVKRTIMIPDVNYTIPTGHEMEARLITDTIKASKDMWIAYDTTAYQSVVKLP